MVINGYYYRDRVSRRFLEDSQLLQNGMVDISGLIMISASHLALQFLLADEVGSTN
jgi:hypothetical protein